MVYAVVCGIVHGHVLMRCRLDSFPYINIGLFAIPSKKITDYLEQKEDGYGEMFVTLRRIRLLGMPSGASRFTSADSSGVGPFLCFGVKKSACFVA